MKSTQLEISSLQVHETAVWLCDWKKNRLNWNRFGLEVTHCLARAEQILEATKKGAKSSDGALLSDDHVAEELGILANDLEKIGGAARELILYFGKSVDLKDSLASTSKKYSIENSIDRCEAISKQMRKQAKTLWSILKI